MEVKQQTRQRERVPFKEFGDFKMHYGPVTDNRREYVNIRSHYWDMPVFDDEIQVLDEFYFNSYQYFLYRRIMFGLEVYSEDEVYFMYPDQRAKIRLRQQQAAIVLNTWRWDLVVKWTNRFLLKTFPHSKAAMNIVELFSEVSEDNIKQEGDIVCSITFEQLGIGKKEIAQKLVSERLLPQKFFQMDIHDDPRFRVLNNRNQPKLDQ